VITREKETLERLLRRWKREFRFHQRGHIILHASEGKTN
jgi:transposase